MSTQPIRGRSLGRAGAAQPLPASNALVAYLLLIGVALPSSITVYVGGAKFIPARIAICLLLLPALFQLFRNRRIGAPDICIFAAAIWMLAAVSQTDESWSNTAAVVLEFAGGYILARAYFFERLQLETFVRVLKIITISIVLMAALEHLTGNNIPELLLGMPNSGHEYRYGLMRAYATFPHAILYGTFCAVAGAILLYSERTSSGRIMYGGICLIGCLLAMSTAPLMAFSIAIAVYCYDRFMSAYPWRWQVILTIMIVFLVIVFATANKPVSWLVAHLTLDPATGYFRVATWDNALHYIGLSPYVGYGFASYAPEDFFANASADAVWLTMSLRFGVPATALLFLANIISFYRSGPSSGTWRFTDPCMSNLRTGFTLALALFMFVGFTVHYWNNIWILWGICIGIRASLREEYFKGNLSPAFAHWQGDNREVFAQTVPGASRIASHPLRGIDGVRP